jgi:hypothetical protein
MPPLPHPRWPPCWFRVIGWVSLFYVVGGIAYMTYSVVHFINKLW